MTEGMRQHRAFVLLCELARTKRKAAQKGNKKVTSILRDTGDLLSASETIQINSGTTSYLLTAVNEKYRIRYVSTIPTSHW